MNEKLFRVSRAVLIESLATAESAGERLIAGCQVLARIAEQLRL